MRRAWLLVLAACGAAQPPVTGSAPHRTEPTAQELADGRTERPVTPAHPWVDPDMLPTGAIYRVGSRRRYAAMARQLAVSNDGRVISSYEGVGVVEWRQDGLWRVLSRESRLVSAAYDEDGTAVWIANGRLWQAPMDEGATSTPLACSIGSPAALSPGARVVACLERAPRAELRVARKGEPQPLSRIPVSKPYEDRVRIAVNHAGKVALADESAVEVFDPDPRVAPLRMDVPAEQLRFDASRLWLLRAEGRPSSSSQRLVAYDPDSGEQVNAPETALAFAFGAFAVTRAGGRLAIGLRDADTYKVAAIAPDGAIAHSWELPDERLLAVELSPDGQLLAALVAGGRMLVVDAVGGAELARTPESFDDVAIIASSRDARRVLVGGDRRVELHDLHARARTTIVSGPETILRPLVAAFAPDDRRVALANGYGALMIADATTGQKVCERHDVPVTSLIWERDGTLIAQSLSDRAHDLPSEGSMTVLSPDCSVRDASVFGGGVWVLDPVQGDTIAMYTSDLDASGAMTAVQPWVVDLRTGRRSKNGQPIASARFEQMLKESWHSSDQARSEESLSVLSQDSRSRAYFEWEGEHIWLRCEDASSGDEIAVFEPPSSTMDIIGIAAEGSWMGVAERTTALVYPCRGTGANTEPASVDRSSR